MASADGAPTLPRYDASAGELRLLDPQPNATDALIRRYVDRRTAEAESGAEEEALTEADGYALLAFARRSAVFALRTNERSLAASAAAACELVIHERVDPRDVLVARAIVDHALARTAAGVTSGPDQGPSDLRDRWGQVEAMVDGGIGLIGWGFKDWSPSLDLVGAIIEMGRVFDADRYVAHDPMVATELPAYWLRGPGDDRVEAALARARATASVSGSSRSRTADAQAQRLTAWLVEFGTTTTADEMAAIGRRVTGPFVSVVSAAGPLLCLVVARSFVEGVPAVETGASMSRFVPAIDAIMSNAGT